MQKRDQNKKNGRGLARDWDDPSRAAPDARVPRLSLEARNRVPCCVRRRTRWCMETMYTILSYTGAGQRPVRATRSCMPDGEILGQGWVAWLLNRVVASFDEASVRDKFEPWPRTPASCACPHSWLPLMTLFTGNSPRE